MVGVRLLTQAGREVGAARHGSLAPRGSDVNGKETAMKGLDLAEAFFNEFGLPAIREHFPELADRIGAGLLGRGSQALGADDEFSRDHGWGPKFRLFLEQADYESCGKAVEAKLNELRPNIFHGIDLAQHRTHPIFVSTVDHFFRHLTGSPWPPTKAEEWRLADENGLYLAQAGKVFHDPLGQLTERKQAFADAYYPEDVRLCHIASKLFRLWHYGDYNICGRLARRGDGVTALVGQGYFVEAAMQLAFLFNRRFAPYWKWLHWAFVRLPDIADELEPMLNQLESSSDLPARAHHIRSICTFCRRVLCDQGIFPDKRWRNFMGSFEMVDHKVQDPDVKRLFEEHLAPFL